MNLIISFLSVISAIALTSISSTALASIDYSDTAVEEVFKVIVTVAGVKGHCGQEVKMTVAYKSQKFDLCEGDERPLEEQRANPISSQEYQLEFDFPKGQIAVGESFNVCVKVSDCKP